MNSTIPITLLSGYLGAGKTTILNHVLSTDHGMRLTVLVNDFGKINIDAGLIKNIAGDTIELTNGCVCCTVGDDLGDALTALNEATPRPEHVLIEASGVTNPKRVAVHSGNWPGFHLCRIIVAADAETVIKRSSDKYIGSLINTQIVAANVIAVTKPDLVSADRVRDTCLWLSKRNPRAGIVHAPHGKLPANIFFEDQDVSAFLLPGTENAPLDVFYSASWCPDRPVDVGKVVKIIESMPPAVHRVKGIVVDQNTRAPVLVQAVGNRCLTSEGDASAPVGLVMIGMGDAKAAQHLSALLDTC